MPRPRFTETEYNTHQLRKLFDKKLYRVLILSDCHGWLADLKALRCINYILRDNKFDEVVINGDLADFPYISKHTKHLYEDGILKGYSEVAEVKYIREQILAPMRASTDARIRVRVGNHCERVTKPYSLTKEQLERLSILYKEFETTRWGEMLGVQCRTEAGDPKDVDDYIYDESPAYTFFDKFTVTHGLSLSKNASEKNIYEYMGSGSSGHTHRLAAKYITNRVNPYAWFESGHTRIGEFIEYLPTGKIADWQQGFIEINFYTELESAYFFGTPHPIVNGLCEFNGIVYNGNPLRL